MHDKLKETIEKIVHQRQKPLLSLNLPDIDYSAVLVINNLLLEKNFESLDVILQTPGGDIDAAFQIAKLLRKKSKELNILVPWFSKSAGTLICLAADNILMSDISELGPLDTQIREDKEGDSPEMHSALEGFKALEQIQKHTLV